MQQLVDDFAEALRCIDEARTRFKTFQPGVGPYGEPQVVKQSLTILRERYPDRFKGAKTTHKQPVGFPARRHEMCGEVGHRAAWRNSGRRCRQVTQLLNQFGGRSLAKFCPYRRQPRRMRPTQLG